MRLKIILLTFASGITALVLAQNGPSDSVPANVGHVPGSPPVTSQHVEGQNIIHNPTNGMAGLTNNANNITNKTGH